MRRRGFLQMMGGAIAAPLIPNTTLGAATKAAYPASALHAAIYHAQSRVNFSVFALAQKLGLDFDQTEQLMSDMSARGILGPLQGTTQSGRWALSKVWKKPFVDAATVKTVADRQGAHSVKGAQTSQWSEPDIRPVLRHLYDICERQGLTLHPRCAAQIA